MGDNSNSRPADVLVDGWERAKPVAFDVTVTTPLTPATLVMLVNQQKLQRTHQSVESTLSNDEKCQELGWVCIVLAIETYGNGGKEAQPLSHDWHLCFQPARSLRSFRRSMVGSPSEVSSYGPSV